MRRIQAVLFFFSLLLSFSLLALTGKPVPELAAFDAQMQALRERWNVPGAALAVVHKGRLVLARGYGEARQGVKTQPYSRFRIASLSKFITAAAILKLEEQGRLTLDKQALLYLLEMPGLVFDQTDPRWWDVTVRHLLQHRAGVATNDSHDPMFNTSASCHSIVNRHISQPLQYDPGEEYLYSNFGYCVLGMIIQTISGQSYENYVRDHILRPADVSAIFIGNHRKARPGNSEVEYFSQDGQDPYGFNMQNLAAVGGWVASVTELARLLSVLDGFASRPDILSEKQMQQIPLRPRRLNAKHEVWYGLGLNIRQRVDGQNWWHAGSLPGTRALYVRAFDDTLWVALFNSRHKRSDDMLNDIDRSLWQARAEVKAWPLHDLFLAK